MVLTVAWHRPLAQAYGPGSQPILDNAPGCSHGPRPVLTADS